MNLPSTSPASPRDHELRAQHLNPGGWAVSSARPLATLLGSCVSVCLFDPQLRIGGMNHFLLPSRSAGNMDDTGIVLAGDYAMEVLVNALMQQGARKNRLQAKAFGGGNVVSSIRMAIGERNATFAAEWLDREGIPLVASDFKGPWSRKVVYLPNTGEAFCRRSPVGRVAGEVIQAEADYEQKLATTRPQSIDYF